MRWLQGPKKDVNKLSAQIDASKADKMVLMVKAQLERLSSPVDLSAGRTRLIAVTFISMIILEGTHCIMRVI